MKILIGALSGLAMEDRRARCRATWFQDAITCGMDPMFLMAGTEERRDGDTLWLPCPDDYRFLPQRTRRWCCWAMQRDDWDYMFKCDDDTYVCAERLARYDFGGRDYIGAEWQPGVGYGSGGAGYFLSRRAACIVARDLTHWDGSEDLLVGHVLQGAGIEFHRDSRFLAFGGQYRLKPQRNNDLITTHGVSAETFLAAHAEVGLSIGHLG